MKPGSLLHANISGRWRSWRNIEGDVSWFLYAYCLHPTPRRRTKWLLFHSTRQKVEECRHCFQQGGDFTGPVAAVNFITDASAAKPCLAFIGPGIYTLTKALGMKPCKTIAGSGQEAITLAGGIMATDFCSMSTMPRDFTGP